MNRKEPKKVIHVRVPLKEANRLQRIADTWGIELSEFLRNQLARVKEPTTEEVINT